MTTVDTTVTRPGSPRSLTFAAVALFVAPWLALFNHLRVEWSMNPQYNYGWGVPFLALYLLWRRWPDRPAPASRATTVAHLGAFAIGALLLLPIHLFLEANPDWRLINWLAALVTAGLALGAVWYAGGPAWLKHFFLPIAFLLLSVPWPSGFEGRIIQGMMRAAAAVTVELLNLLGILAEQRGNLIALPTGIVGINEACSGVRSFQSTLMISIFLGEMHRFPWARRALLLGAGVALAFVLNLARSFFLTWICAQKGNTAIDSWHDPAGYLVFGFSFAGLLALTWWLHRGERDPVVETALPSGGTRPFTRAFVATYASWLLLVAVATEGWYRWHERQGTPSAGWTVAWPEAAPKFRAQPIAEETQRILRYSTGTSAGWLSNGNTQWLGFFFRWEPGRASAQLARGHTPEVCMPASGFQLATEHGVTPLRAGPLEIPFRSYTFTQGGNRMFVFFCVWEDVTTATTPDMRRERATPLARARSVVEGRRHLGQQVLQVVTVGPPDIDTARRLMEIELQRLVRPMNKG